MSLETLIESTRLGWWIERFWHSRCFRHAWKRGHEYEDTGYSTVVVCSFDECQKCGAWRRAA